MRGVFKVVGGDSEIMGCTSGLMPQPGDGTIGIQPSASEPTWMFSDDIRFSLSRFVHLASYD
jgi:hypothetical protein